MKFIKKVLENGMTIIMLPDKKTRMVTMGFFVEAGARNELPETYGIAHFLEHMMFKGTVNRRAKDIFFELDKTGANYNAATAHQYTYYYLDGNSENIKELLDIILDIYVNPSFPKSEIEKERKVIIEEMRMTGDSPYSKLFKLVHQKLFDGTTLAHSIIGTENTIENITKKDFINFRTNMYQPSNTVFVIEGNFNTNLIMSTLKKILEPIQNKLIDPEFNHIKENVIEKLNKQTTPKVCIKKDNSVDQSYVLIVFPIMNMYNQHQIEIDMISNLLTSGFSSRLGKSLREDKGLTYNIDSGPMIYKDVGTFNISMAIHPDELENGIKIILKELSKIKKSVITDDEMIKLKNLAKNENMISMLNGLTKLKYFGLNFVEDRNFQPNEESIIKKINSINKETIKDISNKIFMKNFINIFIYGQCKINNFDFIK